VRARDLLVASRPFSWPNTALPFLAAALSWRLSFSWLVLVGLLYFLFPYNLLLYGINDLFDYESDRRNPRKGAGIEGGRLPLRRAPTLLAWIVVTNGPPLAWFWWSGGPRIGLFTLLAAAMAIAYSAPPLRTKVRPGLDSLTSSLHFVLPAVCGLVLAGAPWARFPFLPLVAFLLWGMASHALGAIQDIRCDREAGIGSLATWLGARATASVSLALYLLAACLLLPRGGAISLAGVAILPYSLLALWCLGKDPEVQARQAWRSFLTLNLVVGFFLTQLLLHAFGLDNQSPLRLASAGALLVVAAILALEVRGRRTAAPSPRGEPTSSLSVVGVGATGAAPWEPGVWAATAAVSAIWAAPEGSGFRWCTEGDRPLPAGPAVLLFLAPGVRALPEAIARLAAATVPGRPIAALDDPGGGSRVTRALRPTLVQLRWIDLGVRMGRSLRRVEGALALAVAVEDCRDCLTKAGSPRELARLAIGRGRVRFFHCPEMTAGAGFRPDSSLTGWWQRRLSSSPLGPLTSLLVLGVTGVTVAFLPLPLVILSLAVRDYPALLASLAALTLQLAAAIVAEGRWVDPLLLPIGWGILLGALLRAGAREMRGWPSLASPVGALDAVGSQ
jgi:4-hydroxybenzoate polyprenyltransferase